MLQIRQIDSAIERVMDEIVRVRHHLHAHPELSLKEFNTSAFVRERLSTLNMEVLPPFIETDVVALLNGHRNGKNVTLRADMDALPIEEKNTFNYVSTRNGVMHACGHDGHTAMLLGAAMILEQFSDQLDGSVRFVFQPGEEVVAAGRELIGKDILKDPRPGAVLALHGWPGYPTGAICSRPGEMMAAAVFFKITLSGKGGHGSSTNQQHNPIVVASKIVSQLTALPEKDPEAADRVVVNVSKFVAGTTSNVIPSEVVIEGSVRFFDETAGTGIARLFREITEKVCKSSGTGFELEYRRPYIATLNDPGIISSCKHITTRYMGEQAWVDMDHPVMSSEDFSYYIKDNPGGMFFLGMGEESPGLHTGVYDFNDQALRNGIRFLVLATGHFLAEQ